MDTGKILRKYLGIFCLLLKIFEYFLHFLEKIFRISSFPMRDLAKHREEARQRLEEHALFAEDLGAEVIYRTSHNIARTLAEVSQQRHVTQVVLGQPAHSRLEEMLYGSVITRFLRIKSDVDIHLVPLDRKNRIE